MSQDLRKDFISYNNLITFDFKEEVFLFRKEDGSIFEISPEETRQKLSDEDFNRCTEGLSICRATGGLLKPSKREKEKQDIFYHGCYGFGSREDYKKALKDYKDNKS